MNNTLDQTAAMTDDTDDGGTNSTHRVEVFRIERIDDHPDADRLEVIHPWGYQCCVGKGQFQVGDLAAYVPPDSLVRNSGPFAFLFDRDADADAQIRIKGRRFRGLPSQGLIVPAPTTAEFPDEGERAVQEGDDLAAHFGVEHWQPKIRYTGGSLKDGREAAPPVLSGAGSPPRYDAESWRRYGAEVFGDLGPVEVSITEKVHGANARFVFDGERFHAGSRRRWLEDTDGCTWWSALRENGALMDFLQAHPGVVAYGELFGQVQDLRYGHEAGDTPEIAIFDLYRRGQWVDWEVALPMLAAKGVLTVPELFRGVYSPQIVESLLESRTVIGNGAHIMEGIVIKPIREMSHRMVGRVILKVVSQGYLERKG